MDIYIRIKRVTVADGWLRYCICYQIILVSVSVNFDVQSTSTLLKLMDL